MRYFLLILFGIIFIIFDYQLNLFHQIKTYVNYVIHYPIYMISYRIYNSIIFFIINDIDFIKKKIYLDIYNKLNLKYTSEYLLLHNLKKENKELRKLLQIPLLRAERKIIAKVIMVSTCFYKNYVLVNKGTEHGIYVGQSVIDSYGIVGQVIETKKNISKVLLICDVSHEIPVQIFRSKLRFTLVGKGYGNSLQIKYLPVDVDVKIGDLLVTSGIAGCFPEGYPVAIVKSIILDSYNNNTYSIVYADPISKLYFLNYVIILYGDKLIKNNIYYSTDEVNKIANYRLKKIKIINN